MTDVSPYLNILLLVSPRKAQGPPKHSLLCRGTSDPSRPTESPGRAISTETNNDESIREGSWGKGLGGSPPEGRVAVTYGQTRPTAARPRQQGENFRKAPSPGVTPIMGSFRALAKEKQADNPASFVFSPASNHTFGRVATFGVEGPWPQPCSTSPALAVRGHLRGMVSPAAANPSNSQGPISLPSERTRSPRFLHDAAAAAHPGSASARQAAATTGVGARGTFGKQTHKCPHEGLMRRLWEVALLALLLVSPAAGKPARLVS